MEPPAIARTESIPRRARPTAIVVMLLAFFGTLGLGGWLAVRTIADATCSSYNFISNDLCDEWNIQTPPADALPVPPGWTIEWRTLDCGSGGCGTRMYVLSPASNQASGVEYLRAIQDLGWRIEDTAEARRGDLSLSITPATDRLVRLQIPARLVRGQNLFVDVAICGEGTSC